MRRHDIAYCIVRKWGKPEKLSKNIYLSRKKGFLKVHFHFFFLKINFEIFIKVLLHAFFNRSSTVCKGLQSKCFRTNSSPFFRIKRKQNPRSLMQFPCEVVFEKIKHKVILFSLFGRRGTIYGNSSIDLSRIYNNFSNLQRKGILKK